MRFFMLVLSVFMALLLPANADQLSRSNRPDWVQDIPLPAVDATYLPDTADGLYYLLSDQQLSWNGEQRLLYERFAVKVLSRAGLERAAAILRTYDPSHESIALVGLNILRDGQTINLRDVVQANVLRRESALDQGMLYGDLTVHIEVPDLRVGDIVDIGFVWRTDPLFAGQTFQGTFDHEYSTPVGLVRMVLNWPKDRAFSVSELAGVARRDEYVGSIHRIELRREIHKPYEPEGLLAPEVDAWHLVWFSDATSWRTVATKIADYYAPTRAVPAAWQEAVARLMREESSETARAYAALRMVQDQVRYVGVEVGRGGYFAREPVDVVRQGYGDCKDKALLLVTMLRAMGMTADAALADLDQGYGLATHLPTMQAFDHMIVRAVADGKPIWMDGTASYQAGVSAGVAVPDLGFALPLTGPVAGQMTAIDPNPTGARRVNVKEVFTFTDQGLDLDVTTYASAGAADDLRWFLATTPRNRVEQNYLDFYTEHYPGLTARMPLAVEDDAEKNVLTVREKYHLSSEALAEEDLQSEFSFVAGEFARLLPELDGDSREAPFFIGTLSERLQETRVVNPPTKLDPPAPVEISDPAFRFDFYGKNDEDGNLVLTWHFLPRARVVGAGAAGVYRKDYDAMQDSLSYSWDVTPAAPETGGLLGAVLEMMLKGPEAPGAVADQP